MTRTRTHRARTAVLAAVGAVALALTLVPAQVAQAVDGPHILFVDDHSNGALTSGDLTGAGATALTHGLGTIGFDASTDGSVIAADAVTGTYATDVHDSTQGLVVSHDGVVRVLSTWVDGQPDVSADGAVVWFVTDGQLYRYLPVDQSSLIAMTSLSPFVAPAGYYLTRISVSPDSTRIAVLFEKYSTKAPYAAVATKLAVYSIESYPVLQWSSSHTVSGGPQIFYDVPRWADATTLLYGTCTTTGCPHWSYSTVDVSAPTPTPVAVPVLDGDKYSVQKVDGTWYAFSDTGSGTSLVTSYQTTTDLASPLGSPVARTDGQHTHGYVVTTGSGTALAATSTNRATSRASFVLGSSLVRTGGTAVYSSYADFLRPLGTETFATDASATFRGTLQYSTDRAKTWRTRGWTTGATDVPWPGGGYPGNGRTQKLGRNTWFRWVFPGDLLVAPATSSVRLVKVAPTLTTTVTTSGSRRVVSGKAARAGGTIVLYQGSRKVASVPISSTGAFTFGRRALSRGSYKVVALADLYWAASAKAFRI
jgi:hypothetical protein